MNKSYHIQPEASDKGPLHLVLEGEGEGVPVLLGDDGDGHQEDQVGGEVFGEGAGLELLDAGPLQGRQVLGLIGVVHPATTHTHQQVSEWLKTHIVQNKDSRTLKSASYRSEVAWQIY